VRVFDQTRRFTALEARFLVKRIALELQKKFGVFFKENEERVASLIQVSGLKNDFQSL
jgi:hypothetical protein